MLRYIIVIFIFFIFPSFKPTETNSCIHDIFLRLDPACKIKYDSTISVHEDGIAHYIDSLNYNIVRRYTNKRVPIIESISNEYSGIAFWKEYHDNGILESTGYMTTSLSTPIGIWNYYSAKGKLDSTINYDKRYKVSFCEFYKIAKSKGYTEKKDGVDFDPKKREWKMEKYTSWDENGESGTALILQVDSMKIRTIKIYGVF